MLKKAKKLNLNIKKYLKIPKNAKNLNLNLNIKKYLKLLLKK